MNNLVELLEESNYCVAFTGAGISTLSGICDFRGPNGIYRRKEIDADKIFSLDYFLRHPEYFYTASRDFIYNIDEKQPSIVHNELARLESLGYVKTVITQNIDLLHQKAGSKHVIELHGSPEIHTCMNCRKEYGFSTIRKIVMDGKVPHCDACNGLIKPNIVFFGEMLDSRSIGHAVNEAAKADLMLVLGSSLVVNPAASIPVYTLDNSGNLVIVNDMSTPLDGNACLRFSNLEEVFKHLSENLK